jgi:hypothetical protein
VTPTIVHRFTFSIAEAAQALLAEQACDCGAWDIRIEAGRVVVDVIEPAGAAGVVPEPPKAFQKWLDVATPEAAKAKIYERCEIGSRVDLDYDETAAAKFKEMTVEYDVWCEYEP